MCGAGAPRPELFTGPISKVLSLMMQQQQDEVCAAITAADIGLVIVLSESNKQSKEIAWDHVDRVASRRRTGLKTAGAYESVDAAMQGALERSANTTDEAPRYPKERVVVLGYAAFVAIFFAPAIPPSAMRKRAATNAPSPPAK